MVACWGPTPPSEFEADTLRLAPVMVQFYANECASGLLRPPVNGAAEAKFTTLDGVDAIDRHILVELQKDAHLTNQELADRIGLSPSPTLRRVRRLEEQGIISGYVALIDAERLGLRVTAFVALTLTTQDITTISDVEQRIKSLDQILEAHTLAGESDYLIKVVVTSLESYEEFVRTKLRTLPGLAAIKTMFAYGTVKPPSPITLPDRTHAGP